MAGVSLATGVTATDLTSPVTIDTLSVTTLTVTGATTLTSKKLPDSVNFIINTGSTNTANIVFQIDDGAGTLIQNVLPINVYLSDSSAGGNLAVHVPSGGINIVTGAILFQPVSGLFIHAVSDASGSLQFNLVDTAKTAYYIVVEINGHVVVSRRLTSADYGA